MLTRIFRVFRHFAHHFARLFASRALRVAALSALLVGAAAQWAAAQDGADPDLASVRQALRDAELAEIDGDYTRAWQILVEADQITSLWARADEVEHWQVYEALGRIYNVFENYPLAKTHAAYALTGLEERFAGSPLAVELALSARNALIVADFRTDDCGGVGRLSETLALTPRASPEHARATGLAAICLGRQLSPRAAQALAVAMAVPGIDKALTPEDFGALQAEALRALIAGGAPQIARWSAAERLIVQARMPGIAPHARVYFLQSAALAMAGEDPARAETLFREAGRLLRTDDDDAPLYLENLTYIAGVVADGGARAAAETMLAQAIAQFDAAGPQVMPDVALTEYALARMMADRGARGAAQSLLRHAYQRMRAVLPVDEPRVIIIRRAIDTADPGFPAFALAAELSSAALVRGPGLDMDRRTAGPAGPMGDVTGSEAAETILSLFLAGRYVDIDRSIPEGPRAAGLQALAAAVLGQQRQSLVRLDAAGPSDLPDWLPDLTLAIALQWGTNDRLAEGHAATERLLARATSLPDDIGAVVLGLEIFYRYIIEDTAAQHMAIRAWRNGYDPERPKTAWDAFAAMLVLEAAYIALDPGEADALQATLLADISARPDLGFARNFVVFVRYYNGITAQIDEAALIELGVLVPRLQAAVPRDHTVTASTTFSYANALWAQGRETEAVDLYRSALESYERNAFGRRDSLLLLRSELAFALYQDGQHDEAMLLSQSAYVPLLREHGLRPSIMVRVAGTHAFIVSDRTSTGAAADVLRPFAADAAFLTGLSPVDRFTMLTNFAIYSAGAGDVAAATKALAQADAALSEDAVAALDQGTMAQIFLRRAQVQGWLGDDRRALDYVTIALTHQSAAQAETADPGQTGAMPVRPEDRIFAMAFATYAYRYAEQLPQAHLPHEPGVPIP